MAKANKITVGGEWSDRTLMNEPTQSEKLEISYLVNAQTLLENQR